MVGMLGWISRSADLQSLAHACWESEGMEHAIIFRLCSNRSAFSHHVCLNALSFAAYMFVDAFRSCRGSFRVVS